MKDPKWKEKPSRLHNSQGVFSKIKALFSTTQATAEKSEPSQNMPCCAPFEQVRAYGLEAERTLAQAQEMAERSRRRIA